MMGMSSPEWSRYMHEHVGLPESPDEIAAEVVDRMAGRYREQLPLIDGAVEAVERLAARWPLGVASSSNRPLIDLVLELVGARAALPRDGLVGGGGARQAGAGRLPRGVPAAGRRPRRRPRRSRTRTPGSRSAKAAGMRVIAIPNPAFPPGDEALAEADVVLGSLAELTPAAVEGS